MFTAGKPASSRILVVRLGAMGDIIHTLPAVAWLKQSHPGSHLTWLVEPQWAPLLEGNPYVDRVVAMRRKSFADLVATRRELRSSPYDFAVDFQGLLKSALAASAANPERIYGFHQSQVRERAGRALLFPQDAGARRPHRGSQHGTGRGLRRTRRRARAARFSAAARPRRRRTARRRFRARLAARRLEEPSSGRSTTTARSPRACAANSASRWCSMARRERVSPRPRPPSRTTPASPD